MSSPTLIGRWTRRHRLPGGALVVAWVAAVSALEILGRLRSSEWHDLSAVGVMVALSAVTLAWHETRIGPSPWKESRHSETARPPDSEAGAAERRCDRIIGQHA